MDERLAAYRRFVADVYELAGTSRETSERIARASGQTAARWHVMSVVSEQAATVATIARRLGLTRQSVQRVVNDLVDGRLVALHPNPDHARASLVALTPEGERVVEELFARSEASRTRLLELAEVEAADLDAARATLQALLRAFEATAADDR